jgi:hypothetical protein
MIRLRLPRPAVIAPLLAALASGCAKTPPITACSVVASRVRMPGQLHETSGAALSRRHPGALWSMNDSGNDPELFAVDSAGRMIGRVGVRGATNRDWEDMAAGPCAGGAGDCLYVAEIGDNGADFDEVTVYRVPEPALADDSTAAAEVFHARYPEGPRDAEAFFVLPDGGAYVVTKGRRAPVELYRMPLDSSGVATMERVRVLGPPPHESADHVTGAGATPDGRWIAIRTYVGLGLWRREDLFGAGRPAIATPVRALKEEQGEAVALGPGGRVLLTTEEADASAPLMTWMTCPMQ